MKVLLTVEMEMVGESAQPVGQNAREAGGGIDESGLRQNSSVELGEFLEQMVSMCEQQSYHAALAYYDNNRGQFKPDPALVEFDRLVGNLRHKLAA